MTDRSSALFTSSQREGLLHGLSSEASDRKLRQRIRTRIRDSTVDLQLGFRRLDDEDFRHAFQSNLEPIREFQNELEDFNQSNRVFMTTVEEIVENLEVIGDSLANLEESHYDFTTMMMEFNDTSTSSPSDRQREARGLRQEVESTRETLLSETEKLENNAQRLRDLDEDTRERVQRFKKRAERLEILFGERTHRVQQWIEMVEERYRTSRHLVKETRQLSNVAEELANLDVDRSEDWESCFNEISSILRELRDKVDDLREFRNRRVHGRPPRFALRDFSGMRFDPGMRDTVVDSIAFFLRAASVVGANPERILEEAITTNIQTQQQDRVLDTVDVTIETEDRQRALKSADEKHSHEHFSNAELRALLESDRDSLKRIAERVRPLHRDLIDRILDEPSCIEKGLRITAMQVPIEYHDLEIHVDMIGEDTEGQSVLIDVIESASKEQIEQKVKQLNTLLEEADFEGGQPERGLVVVDTVTDEARPQHTLESAKGRVKVRQVE